MNKTGSFSGEHAAWWGRTDPKQENKQMDKNSCIEGSATKRRKDGAVKRKYMGSGA